MRQLSQSLAANLAVLDKMFGTSADYYAKEITIYHCRGSILLFDGMAKKCVFLQKTAWNRI